MSRILPLARLYTLGSLRRQVHLATLFLAVVIFMLPAYVNTFSLGADAFERVAKDFGLTLITYFAVAMAILLGSTSVPSDLASRSLYPILARPISRLEFLTAHCLAIICLLAGSLAFLGGCLMGSVALLTRDLDMTVAVALLGTFLQTSTIAAICLAASVRFGPAVAGAVGGALFLVGNLSGDLFRLLLQDRASTGLDLLADSIKAIVPDLSLFALKQPIVQQLEVPPWYIAILCGYSMGWATLSLLWARSALEEIDL